MTKLLDGETKLRPIAASFELVTGNRPSPPTIWRWKNHGCKGIPLPFTQVGGVAMISLHDARKWLEEVTLASIKRVRTAECPTKPSARQREAAERLAKEIGQGVLRS
jgi:Protein of unknown function (DUF1580)